MHRELKALQADAGTGLIDSHTSTLRGLRSAHITNHDGRTTEQSRISATKNDRTTRLGGHHAELNSQPAACDWDISTEVSANDHRPISNVAGFLDHIPQPARIVGKKIDRSGVWYAVVRENSFVPTPYIPPRLLRDFRESRNDDSRPKTPQPHNSDTLSCMLVESLVSEMNVNDQDGFIIQWRWMWERSKDLESACEQVGRFELDIAGRLSHHVYTAD